MSNLNHLDISNLSGLEDLNDDAAASLAGGMASFVAFDDDGGRNSPSIEITRQQQSFNLSALSSQIGTNIDNIADRFSIVNTTAGSRFSILLFDTPDETGNPERFEFTATGEDQTFSINRLQNRVSSVRISQLS